MKIVGDPIDGKPIVMHIVPTSSGFAGVLCQNGMCKFTIEGKEIKEKAMIAFAEQVVREEFGVGKEYKMRMESD
jgi:hypothetical protein